MIVYERGVDVSYHQQFIEWLIASQDIQFAFIRWTQGDDWFDSRAVMNWLNSRRVGDLRIARAPYIVWDQRRGAGGEEHFQFFIDKFRGMDHGELPPVIDLELKPVDWSEFLIFVALLKMYFGCDPWLYSGAWFLNQLDVPVAVQNLVHWLTGYNEVGPTMPRQYKPNVVVWQQANNWQVPWVNV